MVHVKREGRGITEDCSNPRVKQHLMPPGTWEGQGTPVYCLK